MAAVANPTAPPPSVEEQVDALMDEILPAPQWSTRNYGELVKVSTVPVEAVRALLSRLLGQQTEQAAKDALQAERDAILASITAPGYGMVMVDRCFECDKPYPKWSVLSTQRCHECRTLADRQQISTLQAERDRLRSEWSVMARACGNWRDFGVELTPEVVERRRLISDAEYQVAARAIIERDALRAELEAARDVQPNKLEDEEEQRNNRLSHDRAERFSFGKREPE